MPNEVDEMRILVLSDTHMPRMSKKLPERLLRELSGADAIIHAGDWTQLSVYEQLVQFAPVYGVSGNNDGAELLKKFGLQRLLNLGGIRIGLVHGHGEGRRGDTETRARNAFKNIQLDAIVYGHSHIPVHKYSEGLLLFNPGSPTDKRRQSFYSFGIFTVEEGSLQAKHIFYPDKS